MDSPFISFASLCIVFAFLVGFLALLYVKGFASSALVSLRGTLLISSWAICFQFDSVLLYIFFFDNNKFHLKKKKNFVWSHYVIGLAFVCFVYVLSVVIGAHTFPDSQALRPSLEMLVYLKNQLLLIYGCTFSLTFLFLF